jgi:hypothetical protein
MLHRICLYLWILEGEYQTPQNAALHLRNLGQCVPVLRNVIKDITAMATAWAQADGFSEMVSGFVTHLLPDNAKRHLLAHESPFIRSLADVSRSPHPTSPAEKAAAREQLELYLGK